jgi:hypothetical protein
MEKLNELKKLLGPPATNAWAALIPQIILWCFRRFCIQHLADAHIAALNDYIWTDMVDFVEKYAPEGLSKAAMWLTPENIQDVHSSLDDYNKLCTDILLYLDAALMDENEAVQNEMSDLLDEGIYRTFADWVVNKELLIFPTDTENGDVMPVEKFTALIQYLIEHSREPEPDVVSDLEAEEIPAEIPTTATAAMNYRRTLRNGMARAITPSRSSSSRTRRAVKRHSKLPDVKGELC